MTADDLAAALRACAVGIGANCVRSTPLGITWLRARALQSLGIVRTFVQSLNAIDDRHARLRRRPGFGGIAVAQFPPQRDRATRRRSGLPTGPVGL